MLPVYQSLYFNALKLLGDTRSPGI